MNKGTGKFKSYWKSAFGDLGPMAKLIKKPFEKRCLRIHNLPNSRKQPESEEERNDIKYRHNWVGTYVLGTNTKCYIVMSMPEEEPLPALKWIKGIDIIETLETTYLEDRDYRLITSYIGEITWGDKKWDELILDIAEDHAPTTLIMTQTNKRVYAPYFGGADIFMESEMMADGIASQFNEWLSPHDPRKDA
jgi:hypothetical protein